MQEDTLNKLYEVLQARKSADIDKSYVAKLFADGEIKIGRKICEESVEVLIASVNETDDRVINESADLLFHLIVLLAKKDIKPDLVLQEIENRMGISGLDEKAARTAKEKGKF